MSKQKKDNSPFDVVFSINKGKPVYNEESYIPFIINKTFAGWYDTVHYANMMNMAQNIDKDMQFDFYSGVVRPKFRKNNWLKREKDKDDKLEEIKNKYNVNDRIAQNYLKILKE